MRGRHMEPDLLSYYKTYQNKTNCQGKTDCRHQRNCVLLFLSPQNNNPLPNCTCRGLVPRTGGAMITLPKTFTSHTRRNASWVKT